MDHRGPELSPTSGETPAPAGVSRRKALGFVVLVTLVGVVALAARQPPPVPFKASFPSERAMAQAVLDRFESKDLAGLSELALDRAEFESRVWPEMPSRGWVDVELAWSGLHDKSRRALERTLRRHGGQRLTLLDIRYQGDTTQYSSFTVRRRAQLRVRDAHGREAWIALFGSVLAQDGRFSVFSYVVDRSPS
jgi:hypothetical protein